MRDKVRAFTGVVTTGVLLFVASVLFSEGRMVLAGVAAVAGLFRGFFLLVQLRGMLSGGEE